MEQKSVITIGRQFGSGGRRIAEIIGKKLGIKVFDKELITLAAKENGLTPEVFEKVDEHPTSGLSYALTMGYPFVGTLYPQSNFLSNDSLFLMQSETIKRIAQEQSCVIVGRCADYILRNNPQLVSIFIHAPLKYRIKTVAKRLKIDEEEAQILIAKQDKIRSAYYYFYSNKNWGDADSYNFSLDSSRTGYEDAANIIINFAETIKKKSI